MSESREIPNGWTKAIFEDLLDYIQPTKFIVESTEYDDKYKTPVLTAGKSFIIGHTNETNGIFNEFPVIIFDDFTTSTQFVNFQFKVKSSAMKILKPNCELVSIKYVFYFMQIIHISVDTHKRYWISHYSKLQIPLPPLPEQHRIVTKIEELFSSLDKGIESLKTAQQQLKVYRQAVLKWAFEGKLTEGWRRRQGNLHTADNLLKQIQAEKEKETKSSGKKLKPTNSLSNERAANLPQLPTSWKWVSLGEIISDLTDYHANGSYLKMKENVQLINTPEYAIMIRATNFEKENFKTDLKYITEDAYNFLSRSKLFGGEILIGKIGNAGKVYFMPNLNKPASLGMNLFALRFNADVNKYIYYHLLSLFSKQQIYSYVKGVGNPTIDKNSVRSLSIALPSYEEQQHIVEELESRLSVCDKIEESIEHSLKQAEALRQSILNKAFEGKLVPQDPNDEPANVLLERIKAEREKNKPETSLRQRAGKTKTIKVKS
ncbi:restriction endonuclease subunit S [bacterium]|nr:restriction endonuclease subunit S [bacterium]